MKAHHLISIALSLLNVGSALQILPTQPTASFPECGLKCAIFQQSQSACGSQTPNLAAENCFCQFVAVQPFYASPDNVCPEVCSAPTDRVALRTWFMGLCSQVGAGLDPLADGGSPAPTQGAPNAKPTYTPGGTTDDAKTGSAWFKTHWQWLVMLIVLIVGFVAFAFFVRWLRDRHQRKLDSLTKDSNNRKSKRLSELILAPSEKSKERPTSDQEGLWGPHQHMAASQGYQYDMENGNYPSGGARADPWRTEGKSQYKGNGSQVQVTELNNVRKTRTDSSPHTGARVRPADRF